ncbi:hypothetical protein CB0940_02974 [Cercospora beticola]|uniref:Uncharacterized protein n=1 Tax=Cercospora beticola TaxID=122368 RepID=A0A2G5I2A4_CERBT|nr:hypothetical protein CB0940_02974 [Cercospora beticola]PIA98890.1 hypothetical protein CB0940_02974 [Cercospora beticola]WPB00136.1 hypothetical protein RHO25_004755 [Cercospora beticola]CAK1361679.1 unnamed protein product [Cercospora beticola]
MSATTPNNKNGAQGEKAAEEVKGGLRGLNSLAEGIRKNINTFADDLIGNKKTHESTGFSSDAKLAGKEVEDAVSGSLTTTTTHPTTTTDAAAPVPATNATGTHGVSDSTTAGHAPAPAAAPVVSGSTPDSHATGQPVVGK